MKTKEELTALQTEAEAVSKKLRELTDEEPAQVTGGADIPMPGTSGGSVSEIIELMLNTVKELKNKTKGSN